MKYYHQIDMIISQASKMYRVPEHLAKAVAWAESKWDSKASSFDGGHGKGLFQIDDRFHSFAKTPNVWKTKANAEYGCKFLHELHQTYKNWPEAIQHYNGSNDVAKLYAYKVWYYSQVKPWKTFLK